MMPMRSNGSPFAGFTNWVVSWSRRSRGVDLIEREDRGAIDEVRERVSGRVVGSVGYFDVSPRGIGRYEVGFQLRAAVVVKSCVWCESVALALLRVLQLGRMLTPDVLKKRPAVMWRKRGRGIGVNSHAQTHDGFLYPEPPRSRNDKAFFSSNP
ncbi:hypothetical protein BJX62DRAFT_218995 [Aspergillus germanicus]